MLEYQVSTVRTARQLTEEINEWASNGWRVVSVTSHDEQLVAVLERES